MLGGFIYGHCGEQGRATVPLIGVSSAVTILDTIAQVELKQRFENQNEFPVEANYEYPLPDGAAVTGFTIEIDGKIINAKIKEKEQAEQIYDDAIAEGHGAYMLQQTTDVIFTTSVGNLPPGKAVLITIVYVQKLDFMDGELEFIMPTNQYAPNGYRRANRFTKPKADTFDDVVPYGVKVHATIQTKRPIVSLHSPSHIDDTIIPSKYKGLQTGTAEIHIKNGQPLFKHWLLHLKLDNEHEPTARAQLIDEKQAVAMVSYYPDISDEVACSEIVFVVDRSGSMAGDKMKRVKDTLDLFLRSLPEGILFNIVSFGTKFEKKFPNSVEYNEKNFKEASEYVKKMFATMGGTNIIDPLKSVFSEPLIEGVPRQVFLLTDGEVDNSAECVEMVKNFAKSSRVFMFGIGREADGNLVRDMAKAGNGRYEMIIDNNDMEERVMRHLSFALQPALVNPKIDWGTLNVLNTAPYHCPPLFAGNNAIYYAFVPANTSGTHEVTLTAKIAHKGHYKETVSINFDEKIEGNFISKLAARVMIDDLASGYSSMHDDKREISKKFIQNVVDDTIVQLSLANQGAYMLQQTTDTRFTTSVGNLPPGKAVLITIVYVQKLDFMDGELEFIMPTTQYAPNGYGRTIMFTKPKADTFDDVVPYGVKVHATIQTKKPIMSLHSPSHEEATAISSAYKGQQSATAGIHITSGEPLTKHWLLRLKLDNEHEPTARVQLIDEKQAVAMLAYYPDISDDGVYSEIVFVVDRSGSMAGDKMKRVKETLDLFLRSLPEGTMFNIVSFGTKFEKKFPNSVEYNEKNFKEASEYVKKMFATMGGTNIIDPLKSVFSEPLIEGVPRQVFLLTDGEVDNSAECVEMVQNFAKSSRVFMFGIGREADGNLVRDMAKAGNGRHETIIDNNDMEEKVMRHLSYALQPALVNPKIDWGTLNVLNTAPYHCPPLFAGNHTVYYAFVPANTSGTHKVTLTATTARKGQYKTTAVINFDEKIEGNFISKLAARVMIDDLASGYSSMHDDKRDVGKKFTQKDVDSAIVQLSLSNQVMSKLTAFVAVEKRRAATQGTMKSVEIYGRYEAPLCPRSVAPSSTFSSSLQPDGAVPPLAKQGSSRSSSMQQQQQFEPFLASNTQDFLLGEASKSNPADKEAVRAVIQQQAFSGSFDMKALNSVAPKIKLDKVRDVLKQSNIAVSAKSEAAAVTLMVAVLFSVKFGALKSVWDLVAKKARSWVKKELGGIDLAELETAARTYLTTVV